MGKKKKRKNSLKNLYGERPCLIADGHC